MQKQEQMVSATSNRRSIIFLFDEARVAMGFMRRVIAVENARRIRHLNIKKPNKVRLVLLRRVTIVPIDFRYGGRFSRAWLQSPRHFVPAGSSAHAIPAEVATCASINYYRWRLRL